VRATRARAPILSVVILVRRHDQPKAPNCAQRIEAHRGSQGALRCDDFPRGPEIRIPFPEP